MRLLDELAAAAEQRARLLPDLPPRRRRDLGRFASALRGRACGQLRIVAEFKRASPMAGSLTDEEPVAVARRCDARGAAALSIVTEPTRYRGSLDDLRAVAAVTPLPLLCKDVVVDRRQVAAAAAAGASAVLLIARILPAPRLAELVRAARDHAIEPLIECRDELDLARALAQPGALVGVSDRDLDTLAIDRDRAARLLKRVPPGRVAIADPGDDRHASLAPLAGVADALLVDPALLRWPAGRTPS
jgi:indole-3-glycerol phosphate synthase